MERKNIALLIPFLASEGVDLKIFSTGSGKQLTWKHEADCGCVHKWTATLNQMTRAKGLGCHQCTGKGAKLVPCCAAKSVVGDPRFAAIASEWSSDNPMSPNSYFPQSNKIIIWQHIGKCGCIHKWSTPLCKRVKKPSKCAQCAHKIDIPCCTKATVAENTELMQQWNVSKNNALGLRPDRLYLQSNIEVWWLCPNVCNNSLDCVHEWKSSIYNRRKNGCPYHGNHKGRPCCTLMSLANERFASLVKEWDPENPLQPRDFYPNSNALVTWICVGKCGCLHRWNSSIANRVNLHDGSMKRGCPYCAVPPKQICCSQHTSSLARWDSSKLKCIVFDNRHNVGLDITKTCIKSHRSIWFQCNACQHLFSLICSNATSDSRGWCPFCSGRRGCMNEQCKICRKMCEVCLSRLARYLTPRSQRCVCSTCVADVKARDPSDTPLKSRAKISLEIYMLAELQNMAVKKSWLLQECTSWDCPILPTLSFRPDCMWVFDSVGNLFKTVGTCKLNTNEIGYALQLEIIEESASSHSKTRTPSDAVRETEIRHLFATQHIPLGIVYCTVAHTTHTEAHDDDRFFIKDIAGEYGVIPTRYIAWQERIQAVFDCLEWCVEHKSNGTFRFGA